MDFSGAFSDYSFNPGSFNSSLIPSTIDYGSLYSNAPVFDYSIDLAGTPSVGSAFGAALGQPSKGLGELFLESALGGVARGLNQSRRRPSSSSYGLGGSYGLGSALGSSSLGSLGSQMNNALENARRAFTVGSSLI